MNRRRHSVWPRTAAAMALTVTLTACGSSEPGATKSADQPSAAAAPGKASANANAAWTPTIRTAAVPADPCGWIPAPEVEEVMGAKLAEPPKKEDGCRYTFVLPEAVAAKRQEARVMQEKIKENMNKAFGLDPAAAPSEPEPKNPFIEAQNDPRSYAVTVNVDLKGGVEGEIASTAMAKEFGLPNGVEMDKMPTAPAKAPTDWDDARRVPYGFSGRVGHVKVTVRGQSPDVPKEPMQTLAARVRDKIPDLPFPITNPYQVGASSGDPCSLLTRAEAEAVLGPLAIDPYRSSSEWPPLAHGQGAACAYFTPGHHVFVLAPRWEGGAKSWKIEKGIGGLVGIVAPQESVVIKGPWEQATTAMAGALLFLKGDRLLEVHYRTSRATRGDAVRLAAIAMPRLAP